MNRLSPSSLGSAKAGWVAVGVLAAALLLAGFMPPAPPPPLPDPALQPTNTPPPLHLTNQVLRVEVRQNLPTPSAEAAEAVEQGRFIMHITHPDESRLVRIMVSRGGLVLAESGQQLYLLGPAGRTPVTAAGVLWSDYSLQRMWSIGAAQSVTALGYPASASDQLYLVMPLAWEKGLAGALEALLPEPITAYTKASLRAEESTAGYLTLTLQSVVHRDKGTQIINQSIKGL